MQAVLVMFRSDGERRSFSIARDMTVIGRREDCDLRIPLGDVSRKHCRVVRDGDSLKLEDLGSSNGTFHNGKRVQEAPLDPGDSIQVGPVVFVLQVNGVPADDALDPIVLDASETTGGGGAMVGAGGGIAVAGGAAAAGAADLGLEELEPLEEAEALEAEPVGEIEPLEELGEGDFDILSDEPGRSAAGDVNIDMDAEEPQRQPRQA